MGSSGCQNKSKNLSATPCIKLLRICLNIYINPKSYLKHLNNNKSKIIRKENKLVKHVMYRNVLQNRISIFIYNVFIILLCYLQGGYQNCQQAYDRGVTKTTVVPIQMSGFNKVHLRCDMEQSEGRWIVFQRRIDASVDFNQGWNDYKTGFGDPNGNFWLGLERLHRLASPGKGAKLRIDLKHKDYQSNYYAIYSKFEISNEADGYRLKVGGYSGNAHDSMSSHNGMKFSTKDKDNDMVSGNCAGDFDGGWWFKRPLCFILFTFKRTSPKRSKGIHPNERNKLAHARRHIWKDYFF